MFLLSKAKGANLALALSLVLSASASDLVSRSGSFRPEPQDEDGIIIPSYGPMPRQASTRLLVEYSDESAHMRIKEHILEKRSEGLNLSESNIPFAKAVKRAKAPKNGTNGKAGKPPPDRQLFEEDDGFAIVEGISIIDIANNDPDTSDTIDAEISALSTIIGIEAVEYDTEMTIFSIKDQQKLRGGKGAVNHIHEINSALKTTADQLAPADEMAAIANPDQVQGRRLYEETPYGIKMVQADELQQGDTLVKICVVDSGYDDGHPDLPTSNEHDVIGFSPLSRARYGSDQRWDEDGHGHGTHCAGTIGAIGNNNEGVTSVNPDPNKFQFLIGKGISNSGRGTSSDVMEAINYCVENGAKVISLSLGGWQHSQITEDHYNSVYDNGVLIIAAAGNDGDSSKCYPASYPHVMSVAAVDADEIKAGFSQYNDQVELAAPGVGVKSTLPRRNDANNPTYASWSGTSMATPHVAGVAALLMSHFPNCTNNQIRNVMLRSAKDKGVDGCDEEYGWGIVNAKGAYFLLEQGGCEEGGPATAPDVAGGCAQMDLDQIDLDQIDRICDDGNQCTDDSYKAGTDHPCQHTRKVCNEPFDTGACDIKTGCVRSSYACHSNEKMIRVNITIDNFGQETTYTVHNMCTNEAVFSGGPYNANEFKSETKCLPDGRYIFIIEDLYGDGICCTNGNGGFTVEWDGSKVASGGNFGAFDTHVIGQIDCDFLPPAPVVRKFVCALDQPLHDTICFKGEELQDHCMCDASKHQCYFADCDVDDDEFEWTG